MLDRALEEGDEVAEKKARRAILRQAARERVHLREKAARVLADQRRLEQKNSVGYVVCDMVCALSLMSVCVGSIAV